MFSLLSLDTSIADKKKHDFLKTRAINLTLTKSVVLITNLIKARNTPFF